MHLCRFGRNRSISARHIPLFVAVALPFLADELQRGWERWTSGAGRKSVPGILGSIGLEAQSGVRGMSVWAVLPFLVVAGPWLDLPWPKQVSSERFPVAMVAAHSEVLASHRVLAEDQWADYLIYALSPRVRVFFDGRSDFYGERISRDYCKLLTGGYGWQQLLDKYAVDAVLLKPSWALASLLKRAPGWRIVADDGKALLFVRQAGAAKPAAGA